MLTSSDLLRTVFVCEAALSNNVTAFPQKTFWFQIIIASWYKIFFNSFKMSVYSCSFITKTTERQVWNFHSIKNNSFFVLVITTHFSLYTPDAFKQSIIIKGSLLVLPNQREKYQPYRKIIKGHGQTVHTHTHSLYTYEEMFSLTHTVQIKTLKYHLSLSY